MNEFQHSPFNSFWIGGYECADHQNEFGDRVDLLNYTGHLAQIAEDYKLLQNFHITTVREGIRWSKVEKQPYQYEWSDVDHMIEAAKKNNIQQIWDICHFGFPDDLTPFHPHFVRRFVSLCIAFVKYYRKKIPRGTLIITPVNEISFLSWLGGEVGGASPFCTQQGWQLKYHLVKACIAAIKAMKEIDNDLLIMTTEPLVNVVPPLLATEEQIQRTAIEHELQYQAVDMLTGKICPELGGDSQVLDILGFNYYYNNQWVLGFHEFLPWANEGNDPRWRPLHILLDEVHTRYGLPIAITETSHPGVDRPHWIEFIGSQCEISIKKGIPLWGVCIYPIIDRPDWNNINYWHHSGLWDHYPENKSHSIQRILHIPYANALLKTQDAVEKCILAQREGSAEKKNVFQSLFKKVSSLFSA